MYKSLEVWKEWGGRGIRMCPEWLEPKGRGFANFLKFMGPRPVGMSLGRRNPNGHYAPGNVFWETNEEQYHNRRPVLWPGGVNEPEVIPMDDLAEDSLSCG
jgi:hypothetical protein